MHKISNFLKRDELRFRRHAIEYAHQYAALHFHGDMKAAFHELRQWVRDAQTAGMIAPSFRFTGPPDDPEELAVRL